MYTGMQLLSYMKIHPWSAKLDRTLLPENLKGNVQNDTAMIQCPPQFLC